MRLVGDLAATAPDGEPIELEFYESPENAQGELDETKKQEAPFEGTTVGNVMGLTPIMIRGKYHRKTLQHCKHS